MSKFTPQVIRQDYGSKRIYEVVMGMPLSFGSWQNERCHGTAPFKITHFFKF
jgi:hypothetical protein